MGQRQVALVLGFLVAVDQVADQPDDAEAEQDAEVGRQVGDGLERRHRDEGAEAEEEHRVALELGGLQAVVHLDVFGRDYRPAAQHEGGNRQRHQQTYDRRRENRGNYVHGGDLPADPEHGCRHVADRRPGAAGVRGDDDDAGEEQAVGAVRKQLAHQRDHDDGRRQVIEQRAEEESDDADQPHQGRQLLRLDPFGDDLEAVVRVDHLDDGHRTHQEEGDLRGRHQRFAELMRNQLVIGCRQRVDGP